jgi:hypothetical protein
MILDDTFILSDGQAVTATAVSTNVIDTGANAKNLGGGQEMVFEAVVDTAFATLTSLKVTLQDSADNSSYATLVDGVAIAAASLTPGRTLLRCTVPNTHRRYLRANYTVAGSDATAGKVNAHLVNRQGVQTA